MNTLVEKLSNIAYTANGAITNKSTGDLFLDVFSEISNPLSYDSSDYLNKVLSCWNSDKDLTIRLLAFGRDILEGGGRRDRFFEAYKMLLDLEKDSKENTEILFSSLLTMVRCGISYWKDIFKLYDVTSNLNYKVTLENVASNEIKINLNELLLDESTNMIFQNMCKWMPRKGELFNKIRRNLSQRLNTKMTPKDLRKILVENSNVVEHKLCSNNWDEIEFSKVPGRAIRLYNKTFLKRYETNSRYTEFLRSVQDGKAKMNVSKTVYPHDAFFEDRDFAQASFKTMKEKLLASNKKVLVVSDTSGSMSGVPMRVCISLSALFGSALTGPFHNCTVPFSSKARFVKWDDTDHIKDIINKIETGEIANTNLQAVFNLILSTAINHKIDESEMPEYLLIISDMQFDCAVSRGFDSDNIKAIKEKYKFAGYKMPQIIFWNVAANSYGNVPITKDDRGIMVSGFSQNVFNSIFELKDLDKYNPYSFMLEVLMKDRYTFGIS